MPNAHTQDPLTFPDSLEAEFVFRSETELGLVGGVDEVPANSESGRTVLDDFLSESAPMARASVSQAQERLSQFELDQKARASIIQDAFARAMEPVLRARRPWWQW